MNDLILLAALREGPQHGWALKKLAGFLFGSGNMHNNLVYPSLKKFVANGWVRRRSEPGQRGQTRAVYALTRRGKQELLRRLQQFNEKEATSSSEFRVRVGLFALLNEKSRSHILSERDRWLEAREARFGALRDGLSGMNATAWGREVVTFLIDEIRQERRWIKWLSKKSASAPSLKKTERG